MLTQHPGAQEQQPELLFSTILITPYFVISLFTHKDAQKEKRTHFALQFS